MKTESFADLMDFYKKYNYPIDRDKFESTFKKIYKTEHKYSKIRALDDYEKARSLDKFMKTYKNYYKETLKDIVANELKKPTDYSQREINSSISSARI